MKKINILSFAALASASALVLAGCSSDPDGEPTGGATSGAPEPGASGRACIILPDAASSPRWENGDRPALEEAITAAGFEVAIDNAQGDTAKYATIADQMLTEGCDVMLLVDHQGAAVTVTEKAKAQGIPVIAYDRPISGADYYVSFDNFEVGAMQGQMVVDGLAANGVDAASAVVVYIGGDPADGNAAMFHDGAVSVMEAAGIKPAAEPDGKWDGEWSATQFEQALTDLGGKVDGVWAANDTNAGGVITILDKNGLAGKVPVSGQDASVAGLQNVLLGFQTGTVYKPFQVEAEAAANLAIQLLSGETPTVDKKLDDGTPFIATTPIDVRKDGVQQVIDDGNASYDEICTGDVKAACDEAGLKPAA
ncbi:sugar ABC transporter substrate-binding protein [Demequina sp.]|uniref:sugar ABC transporter substrate-binding protein n=1 Tax=Demequina sp. TaxID=2050685 RepID=UPI003D0ED58C